MLIRYITCDGITKVEEEVIRAEFHHDIGPSHEVFLRCFRPDGDCFEIHDLASVDFIGTKWNLQTVGNKTDGFVFAGK
jgi:hypothetical protein